MNVSTSTATPHVARAAPAMRSTAPLSSEEGARSDATPSAPQVSLRGKVLGMLRALQDTDPSSFRELTGEISQRLRDAAHGVEGERAQKLIRLADGFDRASVSGRLTPLKDAEGGHRDVQKYTAVQQADPADEGDALLRAAVPESDE